MLKPIIEEIFMKSNCTFGAGKVTAILKDRGYVVSERIVGDIMHANEWFSVKSNARTLCVGHSLGELDNAYTDVSDEYLLKEGKKLNY